MTSDELLAKADADPRVIEARARWQRGEISRQRFYQIRRRVAGLCVSCRRPATNGDRCAEHPKPPAKRGPGTWAKRNERLRRQRREALGLPPDAVLPPGGKGIKRQCKKCGERGHFAKTCTEGK